MRWLLGQTLRERRLRTASLLAVISGLLLAGWVLLADPFSSVQNLAVDAQFRAQNVTPNVVLVGIDDAALGAHGRLQDWPRTLHATAVRNLSKAGARVIVYDILFADAGDPAQDADFAQAIKQSGNVVLAVAGDGAPVPAGGGYDFPSFSLPAPALRGSGAVLAGANLITDGDGRVRRVPLSARDAQGDTYASMTLAAMYLQFGQQVPSPVPIKDSSLALLGRTVPLDSHGAMLINYAGGSDRFATLSFDQVLKGGFDPNLVKNKIVIVGMLATAADIQSAPLLGNAHGMEIHANALDTLLRARFLRVAGDPVVLATIVVFVVIAALAVARWRPLYSLALVAATTVAYVVLGSFMFRQGRIINFVDPPVALWLSAVVALGYRAVSEMTAQREMQQLFGRYLSPQVAKELLDRADRGQLRLGGELREVTVLFADIRGFTPLSARTPPTELVTLLNQHFDVIISRIMDNGGIVNKFAGDAVMALWNAPDDQADHALLACRAALQAQDGLDALSDSPVARWGFGISTGVALAGNVGSGKRLEYTVIGDSVNLAARLCGVAPAGEVWVSANTHRLVADNLEAEELPPQPIKGIEGPVTAYRLKRPVRARPEGART